MEIELLIADRPLAEARNNPRLRVRSVPLAALRDINRILGFQGYPTNKRLVDLTIEPHPYYASLGVVDDFSDELLLWAYDRQCACDPTNKPYYLDCLQGLAGGRESADLNIRVAMAISAGEYGLHDIEEAYRYFTLDPNVYLTDDHIIGCYNSRIDSAPRQKDEARENLRKIARSRNSDKIEAVANDKTMSPLDAFEYLGVTKDTDTDMIISAAEAMVGR